MKSLPSRAIALSAGLGALVFGAYLWLGPASGGAWSDGLRRVDDSRALRVMTWSEPMGSRALAVEAAADQRWAFSPDGRYVVWSQRGESGHDLFVADLRDGIAENPRALSGANSDADDRAPAFGGDYVYFTSNRAGGQGGFDLWRARFDGGAAQGLEPVSGPANGPGDELDPAPIPGEERLVFVAARDGAGLDLYAAPLSDGDVERVDRLCSELDEREPCFSPDGRALVFASDRHAERGFDLYRSARFEQQFSAPVALMPINGLGDERAPAPTLDGLSLEFLRVADGRAEGLHSRALELFRELGRPISWMEWLALAGLLALALLAWLARRHPELDRLTICLLVSVVAHLLLMWWFHDLWLSGSAFERPPRERAPMQIRLETPPRPAPTPEVEPEPAEPVVDAEAPAPRADASSQPRVAPSAPSVAALELPSTPPSAERELTRRPERASPTRRNDAVLPATPPNEATVAAATETAPAPPRESTLPEVARSGNVRATAVEPAAASAAEQPRELALPPATTALRSVGEPDRAQRSSRGARERSAASAPQTRVAEAATAIESPTLRASAAETPSPRRETALALRDREPAAAVAARPAPSLELDAAAAGAPSMSSRAMGQPQRSSSGPARGAPAASSGLGSVARAASTPRDAERAERRAERAAPNSGAAARIAAPEDAADGEEALARSAQGAPALNLDALGEPGSAGGQSRAMLADSPGVGSGPQRAASSARRAGGGSNGNRAAPRALQPQEVARAADAREGAPPRPVATSSDGPRTGADLRELELDASDSGGDVARSAAPAPAIALNDLEVARDTAAREGRSADDAAPTRASAPPSGSARSLPRSDPRASTARSASASESAPERRRDADGASEPRSSARVGDVALDPGETDSVARPAERGAPQSEGDGWVGELAPVGRGDVARAEASADVVRGPERARAAAPAPRTDARPSARASTARAGSAPEIETPSRAPGAWDHTPYQNRSGAQRARALELYGGDETTEAAVERGLAYLARIQNGDGSWGDLEVFDEKYGQVAIGKTALCTLAFLGAGHTPQSATAHSAVVDRAIRFLVSTQDDASGHFGPASAYDHGIATYAIGECLALTGDDRLREVLERAIAQVLRTQSRGDDPRLAGGWGYYHADGSLYDPWPRTSITAWQVMALESARLSGLEVPDAAFDAVRGFLERAHDPRLGAYRYNHDPERLNSAYPTLPASTPAALFALALLGEDVAGPDHRVARDYVLRRAPDGYRYSGEADFVHLARGNPYFWYYGTLAMFRVGGAEWQRWNSALKESLLPAQVEDGSWRPIDVYARYARDTNADRSYTTALCVLSLEVYYRYYLPLLKVR